MFSVFPDGTQLVRKQTSPVIYIIAGCGGCALVGVLLAVGFAYFIVNKSRPMFQNIIQQPKIASEILTDLQNHQYDAASALFNPASQAKYSPAALKSLIESKESKFGKITLISKHSDINTTVPSSQGMMTPISTFNSQIIFEKGKLNAKVIFHNNDPFHPVKGATDFELSPISSSKVKVRVQGGGGPSINVNVDTDEKEKTTK